MNSILIEKVSNGYIVREGYDDRNPHNLTTCSTIKVFESENALTNYINKDFNINEFNNGSGLHIKP